MFHRILIGPWNIRSVSIEVEFPKQLLWEAQVADNVYVYLVLSVSLYNLNVAYVIRYRKFVNDQYIPNKRIIPSARET